MSSQHKIFNSTIFYICALVCLVWIPLSLANSLETSKSEANNIAGSGSGKGYNGKFNMGPSEYYGAKRNIRYFLLSPKEFQQTKVHGKSPLNQDLADLLLEYGEDDRSKRFDDYGHMRFGKRGGEEQFDDYGHMRFGRSI